MEIDIIRSWKDARYRQSLTAEQRAMLPENPIGPIELTDADLEAIQGQGNGPGGDNIGSNCLENCFYSLGGGNYSCNTFAKVAVNCVAPAPPPSPMADIFNGIAAVVRAFHPI